MTTLEIILTVTVSIETMVILGITTILWWIGSSFGPR